MSLRDRIRRLEGSQQVIPLVDDCNREYTVSTRGIFMMLGAARAINTCRSEGGDVDALEFPHEIEHLIPALDLGLKEKNPARDGALARAASYIVMGHAEIEDHVPQWEEEDYEEF